MVHGEMISKITLRGFGIPGIGLIRCGRWIYSGTNSQKSLTPRWLMQVFQVKRWTGTLKKADYAQSGPLPLYLNKVKNGSLRYDEFQKSVVEQLQKLHVELINYTPKIHHRESNSLLGSRVNTLPMSWLPQRIRKYLGNKSACDSYGTNDQINLKSTPVKGVYMYGNVGCGKTMLMDLFYDTLPECILRKLRVHFHTFMQNVHHELHTCKMKFGKNVDGISWLSNKLAAESIVLCLDEFQCTDIADAMILRRLVGSLMHHGVIIVATSNRHPDELYKNGIQRASFLPTIELIKSRLTIISLDSPTDYRKAAREKIEAYYYPLDQGSQKHAELWFERLGNFAEDPPHTVTLTVWGREINVPRVSGDAACFAFDELVGEPMSAADYLEIAKTFKAIILTDVPAMSFETRDLARRFITLIDALYENRVKLVLTSQVPLNELFVQNRQSLDGEHDTLHHDIPMHLRNLMDDLMLDMKDTLKSSSIFTGDEEYFAFARALSRLHEMSGKEWFQR